MNSLQQLKNMSAKKYVQKFRKSWLDRDELREWLIENPNVAENPRYGGFCLYCAHPLPSKLYDLQSHAASRKHSRNVNEKARIEAVEIKQMVDTHRRMSNCKQITESALQEKEDIFGKYIASELKLIKSQKVYEEVKWEILNTLQQAINSQSDSEENEA